MIVDQFDREPWLRWKWRLTAHARACHTVESTIFASGSPKASFDVRRRATPVLTR